MKSLSALVLIAATGGCAAMPQEGEPQAPAWEERTVIGWRLTERAYGTVDDFWANGGDGNIPDDQIALLYVAVYEEAKDSDAEPSEDFGSGPCEHQLRIEYDGIASRGTGSRAELRFWVDGPASESHLIKIERSHRGITILDVEGASPVKNRAALYFLGGGSVGRLIFTSYVAGRGGVTFRVIREVAQPGSSGSALVSRME